MNNRLSESELAQVIAEVGQLSQRREAELDREQVKQILQELNLPDDLLDDALMQLRRRQALEVQQRRNRRIAVGVVAILVGAIATTTVFIQQQQQAIARISTYQSRITLAQDNGGNLTTIDRQTNPQVYYRVILNEAPVGKKLTLTCDWIDPIGKVAHQSRYSTREIHKAIWPTYCYHQLSPASVTGNWKVEMSLGDAYGGLRQRTLSTTSFIVK